MELVYNVVIWEHGGDYPVAEYTSESYGEKSTVKLGYNFSTIGYNS